MRTTELAVSRDIAASAADVYAAISDVTRMGEWSPECHTCEWLEVSSGAEVGARFQGSNANNGAEWSIENVVTAADPGKRFAFDCSVRGFTFASWGYEIESTDAGCSITETWKDHRTDEMASRELTRSASRCSTAGFRLAFVNSARCPGESPSFVRAP